MGRPIKRSIKTKLPGLLNRCYQRYVGWGQPWCIISVALQRSTVTVMDNPGIEWRGEKMIRWTEREEEKSSGFRQICKKSRHQEEEWDKSHKGKGEISLKRSKLNQSIQFSSVAIFFSESALDRDYIGNSARKSERGRETQRENGKGEGCWPTLNGNSNTASESAKQRKKRGIEKENEMTGASCYKRLFNQI